MRVCVARLCEVIQKITRRPISASACAVCLPGCESSRQVPRILFHRYHFSFDAVTCHQLVSKHLLPLSGARYDRPVFKDSFASDNPDLFDMAMENFSSRLSFRSISSLGSLNSSEKRPPKEHRKSSGFLSSLYVRLEDLLHSTISSPTANADTKVVEPIIPELQELVEKSPLIAAPGLVIIVQCFVCVYSCSLL